MRFIGIRTAAFFGMTFFGSQLLAQEIYELQGYDHRSPFQEQDVLTEGVVTAVVEKGFFVQGPSDDVMISSDGLFVFTSTQPNVVVGNRVRVEGRLVEFARPTQLPLTQIEDAKVDILESDAQLPVPIEIGINALYPPTEIIDDDGFAQFDPDSDGIDFYETLEGMRVTIKDAIALTPSSRFDEVWVLASLGEGSTNFVDQKAITLTETDNNPERLIIDFEITGAPLNVEAGMVIGDVTGVLSYDFGNYRVFATEVSAPTSTLDNMLQAEAVIPSASSALTVAVYNVENLDPKVEDLDNPRNVDDDIGSGKFDAIAEQLVNDLGAPALIALQEVQDNDGAENTATTSAALTLSTLVSAIESAGGPTYSFVDYPPTDDADGGQPGGNIRNAFLYDPQRAALIANSDRRIEDPDAPTGGVFQESRKPVLASFETSAGTLTVVNVHLSSRRGSDPVFGQNQPPAIADAAIRRRQARVIGDVLSSLSSTDPAVQIMVMGDFNAHYFERELELFENEFAMFNMWRTLPIEARRSYVFEGQAQAYDHILVSTNLRAKATFSPLNINAGREIQASDHDPLLALISGSSQ